MIRGIIYPSICSKVGWVDSSSFKSAYRRQCSFNRNRSRNRSWKFSWNWSWSSDCPGSGESRSRNCSPRYGGSSGGGTTSIVWEIFLVHGNATFLHLGSNSANWDSTNCSCQTRHSSNSFGNNWSSVEIRRHCVGLTKWSRRDSLKWREMNHTCLRCRIVGIDRGADWPVGFCRDVRLNRLKKKGIPHQCKF